ncbi:hypothetical protein OHV13_17580 [Kitasatospora purpeofusca]|uniref:hypothetical protein n=1 Tax=Kitasatospora purpeofusca TaxID=67352 RepID=UPI0032551C56
MGERTEWPARDGQTVEVDCPSPARTVVLTVTVDGLEEITVHGVHRWQLRLHDPAAAA